MERLSAQDLSTLWPDDLGWPQDIGGFGVLDGHGLFDRDGRFRLDAICRAVEARLHQVPRFRQCLYRPHLGLGWPLWVDAQAFDIADHVRVAPLPAPADDARLLSAVEQLRRRRWDYSRPLWQMWFLPGLPEQRVGLYIRVHHALADGAAGIALLGTLLDTAATPAAAPGERFVPAPVPSGGELLVDNLRRRIHELARAATALVHPARTLHRWRTAWPAVHETLGAPRVPRTSLNRPIGAARRIAVVRGTLESVRQAAHAYHATINDVLLAAVAGGLGDLLRSRGEHVDGVVLRAYVPVSLHRERPGQARGNRDGMMAVSLPIGVADPVTRLRLITASTSEQKKRRRPPAGALLRNGMVQRAGLRLMARQRWANMYVANVPGPPEALHVAGAPLLELFPIVPLIGNITLGVGALSYADQFNLTAVADQDACPDLVVFTNAVSDALRSLTEGELVAR